MYATMRHPLVTASVANMMQAMSRDRFRLMFARAVPDYMKMLGAPGITMERLADVLALVRRLWEGEPVNFEGIMAKFPVLKPTERQEGQPPAIIFPDIGDRESVGWG